MYSYVLKKHTKTLLYSFIHINTLLFIKRYCLRCSCENAKGVTDNDLSDRKFAQCNFKTSQNMQFYLNNKGGNPIFCETKSVKWSPLGLGDETKFRTHKRIKYTIALLLPNK